MSRGGIDGTFGRFGTAANPFGFDTKDIAVQHDGKILLAGSLNDDFAVARLDADGSPDVTFGDHGLVTTDFGGRQGDEAQQVTVQPNGKIVVGGVINKTTEKHQLAVVRYNANGSLDTSFGDNGSETLLGDQWTDGISGLEIQGDGKILVASDHLASGLLGDFNWLLGRLQTNGAWDPTFGDTRSVGRAGYTTTNFGNEERDPVMAVQPDGRIVLASDSGSFTDGYHVEVVGRYTTSGDLDRTFDGDGKAGRDMHMDWRTDAIAVEPNGQILTVGSAQNRRNSNGFFVAVQRFNANGSLDQLSIDNRVFPGETGSSANAVIVTQPGRFMLVGSVVMPDHSQQGFAMQYMDNGARDMSFGTEGSALFGRSGPLVAVPTGDGKIVAAGDRELSRFFAANPAVQVSGTVLNAAEGGPNGLVTFTRDVAYNFDTRIYFTSTGTATPLSDYSGELLPTITYIAGGHRNGEGARIFSTGPNFVTIPAGQTSVTASANIVDDHSLEPTETLIITAQDNSAYSLLSNAATITIADNDALHVNFQSASTKSAAGYVADTGAKFADRGNGYSYGWDKDNAANMRIRNNGGSPDFRYDSQALLQKNSANRSWEVAVPNGVYEVRLVAGDPTATDSKYKLNLEAQLALSGNPSGNTHWFRSTSIVNVIDGKLTLTNASGSSNNKIAFIDIKAAPLGATPGAVSGASNMPVKLFSSATASQWTRQSNGLFSDQQLDDTTIWN